ncbi:MAG: septum formation initiator family protein [Erysipelotrichaceae bacterium]|nr:septum formation initiator family protein [Erysipelotrichaceae bacterium]
MAKKKRKLGLNIASVIIVLICTVAFLYMLKILSQDVKTTFSLKADLKEAEAERDALLREKEKLTDHIEKLSNDDYVIAYARGEYLLTREGEQIFKLPKIENTEEE